jgi:hypothetical protein
MLIIANSLFKVQNPKKLSKLVMEKLNPQFQFRFKDSRFRNIIELKDAIVEFDRERKEINASKRIQSQVSSIKESFESDFSSPGSGSGASSLKVRGKMTQYLRGHRSCSLYRMDVGNGITPPILI